MEVNTIQSLPKEQCTGCAACVNRCPADCISMQNDAEGFLYPVINEGRCILCGECKKSCPVLAPPAKSETERAPDCFAAWSEDDEIRLQSTSGGVFTHLAQTVLAQGGFVAGARYRADHLVEHALVSSETELEPLRQSKYVQSEIGLSYREIRDRLRREKPVLFAGTPCQCAGLRSFLQKEYENLFLCDFICRGVNSPKVYLAYLRELENRYGSPVKQVWFKNKTYGWNRFCTKILFENGREYLADRETDPFMLGYIKSRLSCYMRPSCYGCLFKGIHRPTDITLGDFWGVEKQFPALNTGNGISLVLIQSEKGGKLLEQSAVGLGFLPAGFVPDHNICAIRSVRPPRERASFYRQLENAGFHAALQTQMDQ